MSRLPARDRHGGRPGRLRDGDGPQLQGGPRRRDPPSAFFRLQIDDTAVDGIDYILLDADGKIAEVTIFWRPLPSAVEMQGHLAPLVGMQPWELRTKGE